MSDLIHTVTLASLREILQQAGYRVEAVTDPVGNIPYLRSATSGFAFDVRPGNPLAGEGQGFADVALTAVLQVQGELPLDLVNRWNATRRFARLQLSLTFLVFCMDVCVVGGVTPAYLRAQIEIWDRLVQELIVYLRHELQNLKGAGGEVSARVEAQPPKPPLNLATESSPPATVQ